MVIQRWQSIFLLLASIMMGLFCYLPLASQGNVDFHPYNQPVYLTLNILVAILSFIAIFLFKNLTNPVVKKTLICEIAQNLHIIYLNYEKNIDIFSSL